MYDFFSKNLPESYVDTFTRIDDTTNSSTRQAATGMLSMPKYSGVTFGLKSIYNKCIITWNKFTAEINKIHKQKFVNKMRCTNIDFLKFSRGSLKETLTKHILTRYEE